jgi:hypothetical protein
MTDQQKKDIEQLVYALKRVEWGALGDNRCVTCSRARAYGNHPCSCPVRLGLKAGARLLGVDRIEEPQTTAMCSACGSPIDGAPATLA